MSELIRVLPFSAIGFLLIRGRIPTPSEHRMMDIILCSILDYSLQKAGTIAARAVVSANPKMVAGLAAGVLAAGEYTMSPEDTGHFIKNGHAAWKAGGLDLKTYAATAVANLRATKQRVPGLGHQVFRGVDPRAEALREAAVENGVWGEVNEWYAAVHQAFREAAGKPDLVMNDMGMLAGIMIQMGFTPQEMAGLGVLSTFPGLIAHVSEELQSGVRNRVIPDANAKYTVGRRHLDADLGAAGWPR
jgi:citrate synthase